MAEFTLPKNSKIKPGKTFANANGATNRKTFRIYRWEPDSGENPRMDSYEINLETAVPWYLMPLSILKMKSIQH